MVLTDFNMLQICDAETLEPKRLLTYADIDSELSGYGICAHPPKDRKRGTTYNYLISQEGVMFVFALDYKANPAKLLWKTALPCPPCYIHSLAITQDYVVFIRNVSRFTNGQKSYLHTHRLIHGLVSLSIWMSVIQQNKLWK
jgi:torulene dioxygenase